MFVDPNNYISICLFCLIFGIRSETIVLPNNEAREISLNGSVEIQAQGVTEDVMYILCQVHSHNKNVTLSSKVQVHYGTSLTGHDIGMLAYMYTSTQIPNVTWYLFNNNRELIQVLIHLTFLSKNDPVPGGCNQEFSLENDPNIQLHVHNTKTRVAFQWGNTPVIPSNCDKTHAAELEYHVYTRYLPADNFEEQSYFDNIKQVLTASAIDKHGTYLEKLTNANAQKSELNVSSYHQRGVIYMVTVRYKAPDGTYTSAAYVPVVSYGCDIRDLDGCHKRNAAGLLLSTVGGILGLFLCYYGHKFFKTENFIFGFVIFALIFYQVIMLESGIGLGGGLVLTGILGLIGGALLLGLWWRYGIPVINVLLIGLVTGYMFSSILFYTPFANLSIWRGAFNYGGTFACGVLIVPVILLFWTRFLSIVSCAVIGSYTFVVMMDQYMKSGLYYIVLNSLRHGTDKNYVNVLVTGPYTTHEIVLTVVWLVLCATGVAFQMFNERKHAPFPPCPRQLRDRDRDLRGLLRAQSDPTGRQSQNRGDNDNRTSQTSPARESLLRGGNRRTVQTSPDREPLLRGDNNRQYGTRSSGPVPVVEEESNRPSLV